jgi:hypothetical protein
VTIYKLTWRYQERSLGSDSLLVTLTEEEYNSLSASLNQLHEYIGVTRFRFEKLDKAPAGAQPLSAADARKELTSKLGVSQLP